MSFKRREFLVKSGSIIAGSTMGTLMSGGLGNDPLFFRGIDDLPGEDIDRIKIQYGHQEFARQMFWKLDIYDPAAATCGGDYYEGEH